MKQASAFSWCYGTMGRKLKLEVERSHYGGHERSFPKYSSIDFNRLGWVRHYVMRHLSAIGWRVVTHFSIITVSESITHPTVLSPHNSLGADCREILVLSSRLFAAAQANR
ncbi:hypothetical protein [Leptolyngbya sp. 7M]|uniref:hypothetical protein n=1 Tax=Leptolyngbya sp. 7M TaxID=2812896 RepID=UPI001B8CED94|nr:hypothetical protein [Leptolyngbya sp. 7M]QYO66769.1 hypothetical protein JVX88_08185 [Leptolyngbya sp. 7M]